MSFKTIMARGLTLVASLPLWLRAIAFLAVSFLLIYRPKLATISDPMIDLLLYIGGGIVGIALTVIGGHLATDKRGYRLAFYILGFIGSGLLIAAGVRGYRAALAAVPPKEIVMEAVNKANEYAGQLANQTVAKANQHTDEQVNMVRGDLRTRTNRLAWFEMT